MLALWTVPAPELVLPLGEDTRASREDTREMSFPKVELSILWHAVLSSLTLVGRAFPGCHLALALHGTSLPRRIAVRVFVWLSCSELLGMWMALP